MLWLAGLFDIFLLLLLVIVSSISPSYSHMSSFELERRHLGGDRKASETLRNNSLATVVTSMQRALLALLLVALTVFLVIPFGWLLGLFLMVIIALEYNSLGQLPFIHLRAMRLYGKYERQILNFAERYARGAFRLVTVTVPEEKVDVYIESREELLYAINSMSALTTEEKALLNHGIAFKDMTVKGSMTPRSVIASIGKKELLGPLVLNDLHKTGHSRFPVIDGDLDHIVGMLYIQDLLVIGDRQRSSTVEKAMEPRVFYVHEDQSLQHALSAFLRTHHHLFVVVNEFQETVGLLSLEDVIEALIGRKIVGEFDEYADLRSVAEKAAQVKKRDRGDQEV